MKPDYCLVRRSKVMTKDVVKVSVSLEFMFSRLAKAPGRRLAGRSARRWRA